MPVLRRDQKRRPAVEGSLIDVRARFHQDLRALDAIFARGVNQRRQTAAVFLGRTPEEGHDFILAGFARGRCLGTAFGSYCRPARRRWGWSGRGTMRGSRTRG